MKNLPKSLIGYSNSEFNLTENEAKFIKVFLNENGCGAETPLHLLEDNFSCQCIQDLRDVYTSLSNSQVGGYLSSLMEKGVIWVEERDGAVCKYPFGTIQESNFAPDLYWVGDYYLESIDPEIEFAEGSFEASDLV